MNLKKNVPIKFMTASEYANMNEDNYNYVYYVYAKSSNEIGTYHVIGDEVFDLLKNTYFISKKKFEEVYKLYEKLTKRDFQIKFAHYIVNGVDREKELTQYNRYWISTPKELFILIWDKYIIKYYTDTIKKDKENYLCFAFYASYPNDSTFTDVTLEIDGLNVK